MPLETLTRPFGTEIFIEIEQEMLKLKNIYPYSANNESYNKIIELCIAAVHEVRDRKKEDLKNNQGMQD